MPLITNNIDEARLAYTALESRAVSAEQRADALQTTVEQLRVAQPILAAVADRLSQHAVNQEAVNSQLRAQQAGQVSPDTPLDRFVASVGLAAALGEATMADRAVASIAATVQGYLVAATGSAAPALRFYQPEFGAPGTAGSASFEVTKTPPTAGAAVPRNLYAVLRDKQAMFDDPYWTRFVTAAPPPSQPARQIVVEIAQVLAAAGSWDFAFLVQAAAAIAALETTLTGLVGRAAPSPRAASYAAAVAALSSLVAALAPNVKAVPVAGDVYALAATLDATTGIAGTLRS